MRKDNKGQAMIEDSLDITDLIVEGDVKKICETLQDLLQKGFDKLLFDGYDGSVFIFKSVQLDRLSEWTPKGDAIVGPQQ
jgi:hypothetical protein